MVFQIHFVCKFPGRGFETVFKSSHIEDQKFAENLFCSLIGIEPEEGVKNLPDFCVHLVEIHEETRQLNNIHSKYFNYDSLSENLKIICEAYYNRFNIHK